MKTVPYITAPKLHDRVIDKIRRKFDTNIDWINYSYPIVQQGIEKTEDGDVTYPQVYAGDGSTEHYDIRPDWDTNGFYFFEFESATALDENEGTDYVFTVTFYARLDKAYPAKANYDYTADLLAEVISLLKNVTIDARVLDWTINVEEIFDKYSDLERVMAQGLMKHGTAFKITFTVHDDEDCYNEVG